MNYFPVLCRHLCTNSIGDWVPAQYSDYAELQQRLPEGETLDFGSAFINLKNGKEVENIKFLMCIVI